MVHGAIGQGLGRGVDKAAIIAELRPGRGTRRAGSTLLGSLLLCLAVPLSAQPALTDPSIAETVRALKPGEFLWAPEVAPTGPVMIVVSLSQQRAYVYRNGLLIGISTVSTGKKGHATPTGVFTILQKEVDHKSNLYDDAPMPFMQRLTWGGVALHAGNLPGYPASHGCIRLPRAFAQQLYKVTKLGLTVIITDRDPVPRIAPGPGPLAGSARGGTTSGTVEWHPEKAPSGPVSIVVSNADRRIVVLRNGVEIGSAPARIQGGLTQPAAYTLRAIEGDTFHWLRIALPGQKGVAGELSKEDRARLRMPESFRQSLAAILAPGATVVVTSDSLKRGDTGEAVTVITDDSDTDPGE